MRKLLLLLCVVVVVGCGGYWHLNRKIKAQDSLCRLSTGWLINKLVDAESKAFTIPGEIMRSQLEATAELELRVGALEKRYRETPQ